MNSLLPLLFSTWWANLDNPHRLADQNFAVGIEPENLYLPDNYLLLRKNSPLGLYLRPWADLYKESGFSTVSADKDNYKVMLDVQQFKPEEISVKVVNNFVVVEAKHEEKRDEHGFVSRQFVRKYLMPDQVDIDNVSSNISTDGVLTILAPLKEELKNTNEKVIKIEQTGKPALKPKENAQKEETTTTTTTTSSPETQQTTNVPIK